MADRQSVFNPVNPDSLNGPFSGFLRPVAHDQTAASSPPPANTLGGIAQVGTAFLEGAAKGRIRAYEQRENEKLAKLQTLNGYVTQIFSRDDITDEAKQLAAQRYYRAMGSDILDSTGKPSGKGKGGKSGSGGEGQDGAHHHFTNILKDIATGMVGGKTPKGAADVGGTMAEIHSEIFGQDGKPKPQYDRKGKISSSLSTMRSTLSSLPEGSTQEDALKAIGAQIPELRRLAGAESDNHLGDLLGPYPKAPAIGSPADYARQASRMFQNPAPPPETGKIVSRETNPPQVPAPPPGGMLTQGLPQSPESGPPSNVGPRASLVPPAPPAGRVYSGAEMLIMRHAGMLEDDHNIEYEGTDGKLVRLAASKAVTPDGVFYVDAGGRKLDVDPAKIRIAGTAEPRNTTYSHGVGTADRDIKLSDGTVIKKGQRYNFRQSNEEHSRPEVIGLATQPVPRASTAHRETAADRALDRKVKTLDAITRVLNQTPAPQGMEGEALARYIWDHVNQYYGKDQAVAPYKADILDWVNTEARKGALKGDVVNSITSQKKEAEQQQKDSRTNQKLDQIQAQGDQLFESMFGDEGGKTGYDQIDKE